MHRAGCGAHACNPSNQEVEAGRSGAQRQFRIHIETLPQKKKKLKKCVKSPLLSVYWKVLISV
jgi:hypothetical protein